MTHKRTERNEPKLNLQRRRVIQGVALTTAALGAPSMANALCNGKDHTLAKTEPLISDEDVSIELAEANMPQWHSPMAQITVTNKSNRDIKVSHLSPGAVTTPQGVYQLNARFGINLNGDDVVNLGQHILKIERKFNQAAGFTAADDRLPEFFYDEPLPPHNVVCDFTGEEIDSFWNF